jgi:hypothetical protein
MAAGGGEDTLAGRVLGARAGGSAAAGVSIFAAGAGVGVAAARVFTRRGFIGSAAGAAVATALLLAFARVLLLAVG